MPKIKYQDKRFSAVSMDIIIKTNQIIAQYAREGFGLSLRQLYYQFVQEDLFPESWADKKTGSKNNEQSYSKLGDIISNGRLAGLIDWDAITDRGRWLRGNSHETDGPEGVVSEDIADAYLLDAWAGQEFRPEIWVEKDALIGVLDSVCPDLDVNYFSCRGYTSQTEMWKAGRRMLTYKKYYDQKPVIIHMGDHDPSGIDMSRDIVDRLELFTGWFGDVEFTRVALNRDQIDQYRPPPNPAKMTDSRFREYLNTHGDECWELDALRPQVLADLIRETVLQYRNESVYQQVVAQQDVDRDLIRRAAADWGGTIDRLREDDLEREAEEHKWDNIDRFEQSDAEHGDDDEDK